MWQVSNILIHEVRIIEFLQPQAEVYYKQCRLPLIFGAMLSYEIENMFPGTINSFKLTKIMYNIYHDSFIVEFKHNWRYVSLAFAIKYDFASPSYRRISHEILANNMFILQPIDIKKIETPVICDQETVCISHLVFR